LRRKDLKQLMDSAIALFFSRLTATTKIFPPFLFSFCHPPVAVCKGYRPCVETLIKSIHDAFSV
jgi:hypothetical protein